MAHLFFNYYPSYGVAVFVATGVSAEGGVVTGGGVESVAVADMISVGVAVTGVIGTGVGVGGCTGGIFSQLNTCPIVVLSTVYSLLLSGVLT